MKKILKEKIYGEHGRRWHKSTGTNWFKRNKNEIIIACVLVAALTFAYYMH